MGTVPQMQPTNNQTAGTTTSPMTSRISGSPLAATVPIAAAPTGTLTGVGATTAGQPFGVPAPSPVLGTPSGISAGISTVGGDDTVLGDFQATYGQGTGTALEGVLAGLGTATSGAVTATNQGILDSAQKQYANMQATQAAQGVSADSSTAALAAGDFMQGVNQNISTTDAGIQLSEENTLIGALQNEGSAHGPDESTLDSILSDVGSIGGLIGAGANALDVGTSLGASGTTSGSILDVLAGL